MVDDSGSPTDAVRGAERATPALLERARRIPVTLLLCAALIAAVIAGRGAGLLDALVLDARAFWSEPWRLFATHFATNGFIPTGIGLAWLLWLGGSVERHAGSSTYLAVCAFTMIVASFAMQAFSRGSVGPGCIICGLFGFAEIGGRRWTQLRGALTRRMREFFSLWALASLIAPLLLAHAPGMWGPAAALCAGGLAGFALDRDGRMRLLCVPLASVLLVVLALGATIWRTAWNFGAAVEDYLNAATVARDAHDLQAAEVAAQTALRIAPEEGHALWMLACLASDRDDLAAATDLGLRAAEHVQLTRAQMDWLLAALKRDLAQCREDRDDAARFEWARRGVTPFPGDLELWRTLDELALPLGHKDWKARARTAVDKLEGSR